MHKPLQWAALAFCGLLLAGCKDKHEPLKPTVGAPAVLAPAHGA